MLKSTLIFLVLALPASAGTPAKEPLRASHTDRFTVSAPGAIQIKNSFGELDIQGWDRPEVEVTVMRSTEHVYTPYERSQAQSRLDQVQVTAKQDANDVVIGTVYPRRNRFLHPLSQHSDIEISYRIKAPRASKLLVDHNSGGVNIFDISGDIHATVGNGQITLTLPAGGEHAIDAWCALGSVYSELEGRDRRRHLLGSEFSRPAAAPATQIDLRVGVGDIVIGQLESPPSR